METVAIDVGSAFVGLCRWNGETLLVRKVPSGSPSLCWGNWLDILRPVRPYQLLYRCTHADFAREIPPDALCDWAARHGARWSRFLAEDPAADPALAAARYAADRHRLGFVAVAEVGARHATLAYLAPKGDRLAGDTIALDPETTPNLPGIACALSRVITEAGSRPGVHDVNRCPLLCFGGAGPGMAARLAERCRLDRILIPYQSGVCTTIGMFLADIVLNFHEEMGTIPFDLTVLRDGFLRLMDRACTAITMEGYDLDNAECRRVAELAYADEREGIDIACDNLASEASLLDRFRTQYEYRNERSRIETTMEIRAIRVTARVETIKPEWPNPPGPTGGLEEAIASQHEPTRDLPPEWIVYDRERLPVNHGLSGPAAVREAYTTTLIPEGWTASRSPHGDLLMECKS